MKRFTPKSLQQRYALFMLLPVALLLFSMGTIGFVFARNALLEQWGEAALLKLERAAHHIDMRLARPKDWLDRLQEATERSRSETSRVLILERLRATPGVVRATLTSVDAKNGRPAGRPGAAPQPMGAHALMKHHHHSQVEIAPPRYDADIDGSTVSMIAMVKDHTGAETDRVEVVLSFGYLMDAVAPSGWWQSQKAYLVDHRGRILSGMTPTDRMQLSETGNALERDTLAALKNSPSGTVIGRGHPPEEVSGFYRLTEAPWYLVLFAPGSKVLSPIIQFRLAYFITASAFIVFILILIRWVTGRSTRAIKEITRATRNVAAGAYETPLKARSDDEIGELIRNFNAMTRQLEERMQLKQSLRLAEEVQKNLLPRTAPSINGLDIAGAVVFCDEIGGDYYDFLHQRGGRADSVGIVIGDVSDHGIPSALLMATVRAAIRHQMSFSSSLRDAMVNVNRQLAAIVEDTGRFVTLFYMDVDNHRKQIRWVRAGHDAAFVYNARTDATEELTGDGLPLGVSERAAYEEHCHNISPGQIIVLGTDGIWETRSPDGTLFGKENFLNLIKANKHLAAEDIIDVIRSALDQFRHPLDQEDDITLVIVKVES